APCPVHRRGATVVARVDIPGPPTAETTERLEEEFPEAARGTGNVVFQAEDGSPFTADQREHIEAVLEATENVSGVESVINPFQIDAELSDQQQELEDGRQELADAHQQLDGAPEQFDAAEAELDSSEQDLDAAQEQLDAGIDQATAAGRPETAWHEQLATQQAQLDAAREEREAGRQQLEDERESYEEGLTEVEEGQTLTDLGDRLLETSNDYSVVSDNDSAAIATVQFVDQDRKSVV